MSLAMKTVSDASLYTPSALQSEHCPLLSLPPEVRAIIYGYYFQPKKRASFTSHQEASPSAVLPQVCSLFDKELGGKCPSMIERFWKESTFVLNLVPDDASAKDVYTATNSLSFTRIDTINRILVKTLDTAGRDLFLELTPVNDRISGLWKIGLWNGAGGTVDKIVAADAKYFINILEDHFSSAARNRTAKARQLASALIQLMDRSRTLWEKLQTKGRLSAAEQRELDATKGVTPAMGSHVGSSRADMKRDDLKVLAKVCLRGATC